MSKPATNGLTLIKHTFFYGWIILAISIVAQILTAPGQTVGVSEFNELFAQRLELSSRNVAVYYCIGTAIGSLGLPLFGFIIDRMGCRFSLALIAFLLGVTCFFSGAVQTPLQLLAAFTFLRMFGQGALSLVASTMVSLWFKKHLAFAYAILSIGSGLGMMFVPYVFGPLFDHCDFGIAFQWISVAIFILVPIALLLVVNHPHAMGLSQDGVPRNSGLEKTDEHSNGQPDLEPDLENYTLLQAILTPAFWIVTFAQSAWALIGTGLVYNRKAIFDQTGASDALTDLAVPGLFLAVIVSQLLTGLVAKRLGHATLFTTGSLAMAGACGLIVVQSPVSAFSGFLTFGFAQGIFLIMGQTLWADFFGRSHIGRIRGVVSMIVVLASSVGGFALTIEPESSFPFQPVGYSALTMVMLGIACTMIRKPTKKKPGTRPGSLDWPGAE